MSLLLRARAAAFRTLASFGIAVFNYRLGLPGPDAYFTVDSTLPADERYRGKGIVGVHVYLPPGHPQSKRAGASSSSRSRGSEGGGEGGGGGGTTVTGAGTEGPKPRAYRVVINLHGGGFVIGAGTDDLAWCRLLTDGANKPDGVEGAGPGVEDERSHEPADPAVVFSITYRLAPAHPFPIGLEDCLDAILAILSPSTISTYSLDPARVALSGFSAGGNLALAAWAVLQDPSLGPYTLPDPPPTDHSRGTSSASVGADRRPELAAAGAAVGRCFTGLCLFYPVLDFSTSRTTKLAQSPRPDLALPASLTELFDQSYLPPMANGSARDRTDPKLSPGLMSDALLARLPPTHMVLCEYDSLIHEARTFAARARAAGMDRDVRVSEVEGARHGWDRLPGNREPEVVRREYEGAAAALREFAAAAEKVKGSGPATREGPGAGAS